MNDIFVNNYDNFSFCDAASISQVKSVYKLSGP